MKRLLYILFLAVSLPWLTSCIRDELQPCPPLTVRLEVGDKNYANIGAVAALGLDTVCDGEASFASWISTLTYTIENAETAEVVVRQGVQAVEGGGRQVVCGGIPAELPFGRYIVTVWGNLPDDARMPDYRQVDLHPGSTEGRDVYVACDTVDFDYDSADFTLQLRRVKGKLIIELRNMPLTLQSGDKRVGNLSSRVTRELDYHGTCDVHTSHGWTPAATVHTATYVAPTAGGTTSPVELRLYDTPLRATPVLTPRPVNIDVRRNFITVVRYDYVQENSDFNIYVLVDDTWEQVHGMDLN